MRISILFEDNHVIAVDKPAGILVQGDRTQDPALVDHVRADLKARYAKPGNVYVGIVHRLDRPVSGVVVFARTSKAASRLSAAFRDGKVEKTYVALVEQSPEPATGVLEHLLLKDPAHNRSRVVAAGTPGARLARLRYQVVERIGRRALVEVHPETGRSHQIRVQLAAVGAVIVGDVRYGSPTPLGPMLALHASRLQLPHPTRDETIDIRCPLPQAWAALGRR
jgi:23S rRNA pseudouridine1911/1915/1917 synthase